MKSEIFFTTGEFANMCEVNKQTLFHYDKIDLLKPAYKDDKGYRYYSHLQLDTMFLIESLKEMETPLKDIKDFIDHTNPDRMIDFFQKKSTQITEKITHLKNLQTSIDKKVTLTKEVLEADFNEITLREVETEYLYMSQPLINDDDNDRAIISDFYHTCMYTLYEKYSIGAVLSKESCEDRHFDNITHLFARTKFMDSIPLVKKEAGLEVIAYHIGNYDSVELSFDKIFNYLEVNNLEIKSDVYLEEIVDRLVVAKPEQYVTKITIPVR